jgi:hypothetical protein
MAPVTTPAPSPSSTGRGSGNKRKSDDIERFASSFDSLDDRLLGQILLRCRAADLRPLTRTCRRFRDTIDCQAFRQERIRTEWAEVTSADWTIERRIREDFGGERSDGFAYEPDYDSSDTMPEYSDAGCTDTRIAVPPGTTQNTVDLMVDEKIVGRAEYALVKRKYAARFSLDDKWDASIGELFFGKKGRRPKFSVVKKAMKHGAGQRDILYIAMVRWKEEYRNNSYIGAKALRSILMDSSLAGQWSVCFYIPDSAMQFSAEDEITCHQVKDPRSRKNLTKEDHQKFDEWHPRQDELRIQDMRQFFRAGFQQVEEKILTKPECRVVFAVPSQLQNPLSTAIAADSVVAYEFPPWMQCKSSADLELNTFISDICDMKDELKRTIAFTAANRREKNHVQHTISRLKRKPDVVKDSIEWAKREVLKSNQELVALERLDGEISLPAKEGMSRARTQLAKYEAAYGETLESPEGSRPYWEAVCNIVDSKEQEERQNQIDRQPHDVSEKIKTMVEEHGATILGSNIVHICVTNGDMDILNVILEFLKPKGRIEEVMNSRDERGLTPLMRAACSTHTHSFGFSRVLSMLEKLLHLGADKDMVDSSGITAFVKFNVGFKRVPAVDVDGSLMSRIQRLLKPS